MTTPGDVLERLQGTPFAPKDGLRGILPLTGGNANFTYRIILETPFLDEGRRRRPSSPRYHPAADSAGITADPDPDPPGYPSQPSLQTTVILKHAEDYVKNSKFFNLDAARMDNEYAILDALQAHPMTGGEAVPSASCSTVGERPTPPYSITLTPPHVYSYDPASHTMIMQDLGPDSVTLKAFVRSLGEDDEEGVDSDRDLDALLTTIGSYGKALGEFLARLHALPLDAVLEWSGKTRDSYAIAQSVLSFAYYQQVVPSVEKYLGSVDPSYEVELKELAHKKAQELKEASLCFCHGDYWTGNILVNPEQLPHTLRRYVAQPSKTSDSGTTSWPSRQDSTVPPTASLASTSTSPSSHPTLFIVDWEMSKPGTPMYDVGALLAELYLLYLFAANRVQERCAKSLIDSYLLAYRDTCAARPTTVSDGHRTRVDAGVDVDEIAIRVGCHLVAMFPQIGWTTDEARIKELVRAGIEMMLAGGRGVVKEKYRGSVLLGALCGA